VSKSGVEYQVPSTLPPVRCSVTTSLYKEKQVILIGAWKQWLIGDQIGYTRSQVLL
jgi:hypothetical protein